MNSQLLDFAGALALLLIGLTVLRASVLRITRGRLVTVLGRVPASHLTGLLAAEVGGGLAAVVLAANPSGAYQLLLVAGLLLCLAHGTMRSEVGRALLGTALALMSLKLLAALSSSLTPEHALAAVAGSLGHDLLLATTLGTVVPLLLRSSLATVLLLGLLGAQGVLPFDVALAMVLGANLGSGILALTASARGPTAARNVAAEFLFAKATFVACGVLLLYGTRGWLAPLGSDAALWLAASHLLFNLAVALVCAGPARPVLTAVSQWLSGRTDPGAQDRVPRLNPRALPAASVALTCAVREVARLADMVETMVGGLLQVVLRDDVALARSVRNMDDAVDDCFAEVKHYLAAVRRGRLSQDEERRWNESMTFSIALEQVADTVERILRDLIEARAPRSRGTFSDPAIAEVCGLHTLLIRNMKLAVNLLLERDAGLAQALATADKEFQNLERSYEAAHLKRLSAGDASSMAVSAVYLDLLGDIERMNTLVCSLAACFSPSRKEEPGITTSLLQGGH